MNITEVQVKLIGSGDERLKASCTLVVDGEFVIRDVKVIEGTSGLFVAMPSRKLTDHCPRCSTKNHLRALYCNNCGAKLNENRAAPRGGTQQMHVEIAHPINSDCRQRLHESVIAAYEEALAQRGSAPAHADDSFDDDDHRDNRATPGSRSHSGGASIRSQAAMASSREPVDREGDEFGAGLA